MGDSIYFRHSRIVVVTTFCRLYNMIYVVYDIVYAEKKNRNKCARDVEKRSDRNRRIAFQSRVYFIIIVRTIIILRSVANVNDEYSVRDVDKRKPSTT